MTELAASDSELSISLSKCSNGHIGNGGTTFGYLYENMKTGETVYVAVKTKDKHFFHTYSSYGIDESVIETLRERGVRTIYLLVRTGQGITLYEHKTSAYHNTDNEYVFRGDKQKHPPITQAINHGDISDSISLDGYPDEIEL